MPKKNNILPWLPPLLLTLLLFILNMLNGTFKVAHSETREDVKEVKAIAMANIEGIAGNSERIAILETQMGFIVDVLKRTPEGQEVIKLGGEP